LSNLRLTEDEYQAFAKGAQEQLALLLPACRLEIVGSLARGELAPPYSDLDLLVVAPEGEGAAARDQIPDIAVLCGDLLTIFVDPFCSKGTFCSIYSGPFKVDWAVSERSPRGQCVVWTGRARPPSDPDGHPWDWIWWVWCKVRSGKLELARSELSKLWQFLVLRGVSPSVFPALQPEKEQSGLERLVLATLRYLPRPQQPVAREIAHAIESDARKRQ
jgi:predicted nucleotidyltransferase